MTRPQQHKGGLPQLPQGWTSFASTPDGKHTAHWYATSPYPVDALRAEYGQTAQPLCRTVTAATWSELGSTVCRRPTPAERAAARKTARADRETITARYLAREPVSRIADAYGVTPRWLTLRLDEWGVPRRQRHEAHLHRRSAQRVFRGRMVRRSKDDVRAAQAEFVDQRTDVIARYRDGESVASLARSFNLSHSWIAERLTEWGVRRQDP